MSTLFAVIFSLISLVGYGVSDFFGAIGSRKIGAFQAAMISRGISLVTLLIIFFIFFKLPPIPPTTILILGITGLLGTFGLLALYKGFKVGNVSIVSPISSSWAMITVLLGIIFLQESLTNLQLLAIALIILGTISSSIKLSEFKKLNSKTLVSGAVYAFIAMLSWGLMYFLINVLVKALGWFPPILFLIAFSVLYLAIYFKASKMKLAKMKPVLGILALVSILDTIAFLAYSIGATSNDVIIVAPIAAAAPAITIILAIARFHEKLETSHKIGIVAIIIGLIVISI